MLIHRLYAGFLPGLCALATPSFASATATESFDQKVDRWIEPFSTGLSNFIFYKADLFGHAIPLIVLWLAVAALFFTLYMGFINIRAFAHAIRLVRGDYHNPSHRGEISHFQAVATAVSGTVGIGNIGGVAVAISIGGPGAAFWLIIAGFLSMSTKLVECTLGVKYRRHNPDGSVSGGPMYYLEAFLAQRNKPRLGKLLGGFYALALVIGCFGIGNMFQSNQAYAQFVNITGNESSFFADKGWLFGLFLAAIIGVVILGGIRSIARVAGKVVPFMAVLYVVSALVIIGLSAEHIPTAFGMMFQGAFTSEGATGGMIGAMIVGFQRALFSNEAGIGSASIAHSAVQTDQPSSEGIVSLLEPFIDTVVICTLTSLVIITTAYPYGLMDSGLEGIALTSAAFEHHISWSPYLLAIAGLLFAFSTAISWSYYGLKGWTYLFGEAIYSQNIFKTIFCLFIVLGCMTNLTSVLNFSDAIVFLIAIPNILGLYLFAPEVKREVNQYLAKVKSGEIASFRNAKVLGTGAGKTA
ncbi:alanine:cation symporter family protein [Aestuariicella hydrocarbonica]|uniref:Alanine:cation symporter family protein n=1 Tax=Pseudomaricurvus hydrocarbonicus TaxID=1470433 RepID=A0A9E5MKJ3_9GAMM|nr:alanine/glycine:cation symporter family protein [Aestuariicella hydrocarbonica]NHO66609.1 alanine:cation symporter family protein [Aestuariicella hydrocarbonica]